MKKIYEQLWVFEDTRLEPRSKYGEIFTAIVFDKKIDEKYVDTGVPFRKYKFYFTSKEKLDKFDETYNVNKYLKI